MQAVPFEAIGPVFRSAPQGFQIFASRKHFISIVFMPRFFIFPLSWPSRSLFFFLDLFDLLLPLHVEPNYKQALISPHFLLSRFSPTALNPPSNTCRCTICRRTKQNDCVPVLPTACVGHQREILPQSDQPNILRSCWNDHIFLSHVGQDPRGGVQDAACKSALLVFGFQRHGWTRGRDEMQDIEHFPC